MKSLTLPRALTACAIVFAAGRAAPGEICRIEDVSDQDVVSEPFSLSRPTRVRIQCTGAGDEQTMYAYGWILDRSSRDVVWALEGNKRARDGREIQFDGWVELPAGDYMASYAAFGEWRRRLKIIRFLGRELFRFEIDDGKKRGTRDANDWGLQLEVADADDNAVGRGLPETKSTSDRAVVQMIGVGNDLLLQQGFTLPASMQLTVYCLGEGDPDHPVMADTGWILDARTRKRVWVLGQQNGKHAGGAHKNRFARETIQLPAGNYVAFYVADDSHGSDDWNAPPPYDPEYWGLSVWAANAEARARVQPYDDGRDREPLVSLIRQSNDAYATQGLTVSRPMDVRVYALGEFSGDSFVDEGWIEEFKSRRRVWEMNADNTVPAGGSAKNRFADAVVALAPGDYVVHYRTDDSHAYEEWNATPPYDPTHWGITLEAQARSQTSAFRTFDAEKRSEEGKDFLVRLVRIGSGEHVRRRFKLDRRTTVHIVALGEGQDHEMFDYAWIENASNGKMAWEMREEDTDDAGGAHKNREFVGELMLDRGEYEVHYKTDGSHAWGDWNAQPPRTPHLWGITITTEKGR